MDEYENFVSESLRLVNEDQNVVSESLTLVREYQNLVNEVFGEKVLPAITLGSGAVYMAETVLNRTNSV